MSIHRNLNRVCTSCGWLESQRPFVPGRNQCRKCYNRRIKQWRDANPDRDVEIRRRSLGKPSAEFVDRRYRSRTSSKDPKGERTRYVFQYLIEHPCVDCGERNPVRLTFDHVRGEKLCDVSEGYLYKSWSLEAIKAEIEKCDVRCWNCHMERTAVSRGYRRAKLAQLHGLRGSIK